MNAITPEAYRLVPDIMKAAPRWLVWKSIQQPQGRKARKVPYYADGTPRGGKLDSPEDTAKLVTFAEAVSALSSGRYAGLGFALGPDGFGQSWQGIDLDGLPDHPELRAVVDALPGYVEASPSRKGVHAIGYGRSFAALGSNTTGIEAYSGGRFFTVSGRRVRDGIPVDIADFVEAELQPRHGPRPQVAPIPPAALPVPPIVTPQLLADIRAALSYIEAHDRNDWQRIGHALKCLGEAARDIWHDWSATSELYDPEDAEATWLSFKPDRTGYPAIFAEAQRRGWQNPAAQRRRSNGAVGHTDEDLALAFARENETSLRYCGAWGQWLVWDGVRWAPDETLLATDYARDLCRRVAASSDQPATQLLSARTSSAVERLARTDRRLAATTEQWDSDPWLLNTPGGVVDLRTGLIAPSSPGLHMTKVTGATPSQVRPAIWLRFLDQITAHDPELQAYLQRALGYCLTGLTSAHALFFGHGTGANGKSVLLDTAAGIMGDYHRTAAIETFTESGGDRHPTDLAMLRGARLVTAAETEEGRRWAESRIKTLTGGDRVSARFMRQDFFEYTPQFKLLIAGNHRPGLRSVDEAMRRRFHLIPFAVTIPAHERDPELKNKLRAEWPAILSWMIAGCLEWQRIGLAPPSAVREATEAYMQGEDAISAWIDDMCARDPQGWEPSGRLFASWEGWAERHGEFVGSARRFTQMLEARGFPLRRSNQARGVAGLRLKAVDFPG